MEGLAGVEDMGPPDEEEQSLVGISSGHKATVGVEFRRANSFCGMRRGCVFKLGPSGLDYYPDSNTSGSVQHGGQGQPCNLTPMVLELDLLIRSSPSTCIVTGTDAAADGGRWRSRFRSCA